MAKFKVGDLVKCVEADSILILYAVYRVSKVNSCGMVFLEEETESRGWYPQRFELVEEPPKTTPHIHAALIKAWADGAKIEFESWLQPGLWLPTGDAPEWSINRNYRIKPEPKPDVVRWFNIGRQLECFPTCQQHPGDNMKAVFDGETGKLKSVEMIKEG